MSALRILLLNASLATLLFGLLATLVRGVVVYRRRIRLRCATRREFLRFDDTHEAHSTSGLNY